MSHVFDNLQSLNVVLYKDINYTGDKKSPM